MTDLELDNLKIQVNEELLSIYQSGPISLVKPINYVLSGRGKRLRPVLSFLAADAC